RGKVPAVAASGRYVLPDHRFANAGLERCRTAEIAGGTGSSHAHHLHDRFSRGADAGARHGGRRLGLPEQAVRKGNVDKAHRQGNRGWAETLTFRAVAQNGASRASRAGTAAPVTTGALDAQQVLLSTLPPSRAQKRLALAVVLVLLAA